MALTHHNWRLTMIITITLLFLQHGAKIYAMYHFFSKSVTDKFFIEFGVYFFHSLEITKQNHINQSFHLSTQPVHIYTTFLEPDITFWLPTGILKWIPQNCCKVVFKVPLPRMSCIFFLKSLKSTEFERGSIQIFIL